MVSLILLYLKEALGKTVDRVQHLMRNVNFLICLEERKDCSSKKTERRPTLIATDSTHRGQNELSVRVKEEYYHVEYNMWIFKQNC